MIRLTLILLTLVTYNALGQDNDLRGLYSREIFMYKYSLSLQDSGRYTITEISDLQSMTITGYWTVHNKVITLVPTSGWTEQASEKKRIEIQRQWLKPSNLKVEENQTLTELAVVANAEGVKSEIRGNSLRREIAGRSN
jgi:hypothetical protein